LQEAGGRRQEAGYRKLCDKCYAFYVLLAASCRLLPAYSFLELILVFVLVVIFFNDIQFDRVEADDL
jgi:hypothetical protein